MTTQKRTQRLSSIEDKLEEEDKLSGATELLIYSPDTDVLVLAIRRYPEMCPDTSIVTGSATTRQTIKLEPTVEALGSAKTAALPTFQTLTGAYNMGSFSGKGKPTCWKKFEEAIKSILSQSG